MKNKLTKKNNTTKMNKLPKLPSIWSSYKKVWFEFSTFWRPLSSILSVYAILYFILVLGFNFSSGRLIDQAVELNKFNQAIVNTTSIFSSNRTDAASVIQFLLFIIASLAFIWTLRQLQAVKKIKVIDAYYLGSATVVPSIIVTIVIALTVFPAIAGSMLFNVANQVGATAAEFYIITGIAILFFIFSLFLFAMLWPAFYIVTIPGTRPLRSLKLALKITKTRRLALMRHIALVFLLSLIILMLIVFPSALLLPSLTPYLAFLAMFFIFGFANIYFYNLYRSMI